MHEVVADSLQLLKLTRQLLVFGSRRGGQQRLFQRGESIQESTALAMEVVLRDGLNTGHALR